MDDRPVRIPLKGDDLRSVELKPGRCSFVGFVVPTSGGGAMTERGIGTRGGRSVRPAKSRCASLFSTRRCRLVSWCATSTRRSGAIEISAMGLGCVNTLWRKHGRARPRRGGHARSFFRVWRFFLSGSAPNADSSRPGRFCNGRRTRSAMTMPASPLGAVGRP